MYVYILNIGTDNPFADFGFGQSVPFASRLQRNGPRKVLNQCYFSKDK